MLEQQFRIKYSEIMENFQCIEYDLKRIYSAMSADDFDENMDMLDVLKYGQNFARSRRRWIIVMETISFRNADYDTLERNKRIKKLLGAISVIWTGCTVRIAGRKAKLQKVYNRLVNESNRVAKLQSKDSTLLSGYVL